MATTKSKKTSTKKNSQSKSPKAPEKSAKTVKAEKLTKQEVAAPKPAEHCAKSCACAKGIFAKKCDASENILTIFKSNKIWGSLIGELVGTMLITIILMMFGVNQILYAMLALVAIIVMVVNLSGAHLNPIVTVSMMATRRISAIRGVLYIIAQIVGAWFGVLILGAFRGWGGELMDIPVMTELVADKFWITVGIEALAAAIIGFTYSRALEYKRSALTFGVVWAGGLVAALIIAFIISYYFIGANANFIANPAIALMMQIFPTAGESVGEVLGGIGLALCTYVIFPVIGGFIGFLIAEIASKLVTEEKQ